VGSGLVFAQNYQPDSEFYRFIAINMLAFFFLQMIFMGLGIFLGCIVKKHKQAGSMAVSILLISYFLSILTEFSKELDFLKYISPFKYFEASALLHESKLETLSIVLSLVSITCSLAGAYFSYSKRDIYI
jgi:ABC-2 type transport system permease protein